MKLLEDIHLLSVAERVQLVEDIWDSLLEAQAELPITAAQRAELDRRLDAHESDPGEARLWDEVLAVLTDQM